MPVEIIGDRFVSEAPGAWRDLATGHPVAVEIVSIPADWEERSHALAEEMAAGGSAVVDFGRLGVERWFEARCEGMRPLIADEAGSAAGAVDEVVAAASRSDTVGVRVVKPATTMPDPVVAAGEIARRLRTLGFVSVRAGVAIPSGCVRELNHRHLAVLLLGQGERHDASEWIRRLGRISVRGHLLVDLSGGPDRSTGTPAVRERLPVAWSEGLRQRRHVRAGPAFALIERARCQVERGRARDAEQWYRAAIESGRRYKSDLVQVEACRALMRLQMRRDAWIPATDAAEQLLTTVVDCSARGDLSVALADVYLARGDVLKAEALLASAVAGFQVIGEAPAPDLRRRQAELRFWQGRFEEAAALLRDLPSSTETLALHGLICWATGHASGLNHAVAGLAVASTGDSTRRFWTCALALLGLPLETDARRLVSAVTELDRTARETRWPGVVRFGRIVMAEALLARGHREQALEVLGRKSAWAGAPVRDLLLHARIEARARGAPNSLLDERIDRTGLLGIRRWGTGSKAMHLIHMIPVVLELVHDAEDELSALTAACRWTRRECGADAVAFFAAGDGRIVISDGWGTPDADRIPFEQKTTVAAEHERGRAMAPVRYAGVNIGFVAVRGPAERAATLEEAVRVLSALCAPALKARLDAMALARQGHALTPEILGRSPAIVSLKETIGRAATTPFTVLIEGESGTGKELVARAIHRLSPRRDRRFAAFNCAAISDELVEAELFGHARGAFTGAIGTRAGLFEDAHAGSIFLDEVSELSGRAQAKLLRVLQEREVRRVGENIARPIDVRVIAATNRPLAEAVRAGAFREDLLFRLAVVCIRLPPLRDRIEDLPLLADACWRSLTREAGKRAILAPDALASLCRHDWPGNVREFQNVMAALVVLAPMRGRVGARHVGQVIGPPSADREVLPLEHLRARCERHAVTGALARHGGRRAPAARELGLTRQGLAKAMKRLGLTREVDTEGVA